MPRQRNPNRQYRETAQDSEGASNTLGEKTTTETRSRVRWSRAPIKSISLPTYPENPSVSGIARDPSHVLKDPSYYEVEGLIGSPHQLRPVTGQPFQRTGLTPSESKPKPVHLAGGNKAESTSSAKVPFPSPVLKGPSDYVVEGLVGEHQVNGLVDTGAERNFVSAQFVRRTRLIPYESKRKKVQLPGGRKTESTGTVKVPFSFSGEPKQHILDCWIIPTCTSDLILSNGFLQVTQTLTKFKNRIKKLRRSVFGSRLRMSLLGDERQRLWGSMDTIYTHALLDTGCDLDLVGADWARANNFTIDRGPEHRLPLELGDGTRISTTGIIRDVTWTFGDSGEKVRSDFYVLDALSADVVFGGDFIMERDVFSEFSHFMIHLDSEARAPELGIVRLLSDFSPALARLEEEAIKDMSSDNARQAERVLRGRVRDAINELPVAKQDEAWEKEFQRRLVWQRYYDKHELEQESEDTASCKVVVTQGSCQNVTNPKRRWWRRISFLR